MLFYIWSRGAFCCMMVNGLLLKLLKKCSRIGKDTKLKLWSCFKWYSQIMCWCSKHQCYQWKHWSPANRGCNFQEKYATIQQLCSLATSNPRQAERKWHLTTRCHIGWGQPTTHTHNSLNKTRQDRNWLKMRKTWEEMDLTWLIWLI